MHSLTLLFNLISPTPHPPTTGPAQRLAVTLAGALASLVFAAIWGIAAGSSWSHIALGNIAKVPILLVASTAASLPVGILIGKLTSTAFRATDLLVAHAAALFTGTLFLALLAPLIALYTSSSTWAGPVVAFGSTLLAFLVGLGAFVRVLSKLLPSNSERRAACAPVIALVVVQLAALSQLASITSPVFSRRSHFGQGVDGIYEHDAP